LRLGFAREIGPLCEALKTDRAGKIGEAIVRPLVCLPSGHLRVAVRQVLEHRGVKPQPARRRRRPDRKAKRQCRRTGECSLRRQPDGAIAEARLAIVPVADIDFRQPPKSRRPVADGCGVRCEQDCGAAVTCQALATRPYYRLRRVSGWM